VNQPVPEGVRGSTSGRPVSGSVGQVRAARADFAESIRKEKFIEAQVIEKQFGFQPDKPDEAFRVLLTAPKQDQIRMIDTLSKHFLTPPRHQGVEVAGRYGAGLSPAGGGHSARLESGRHD